MDNCALRPRVCDVFSAGNTYDGSNEPKEKKVCGILSSCDLAVIRRVRSVIVATWLQVGDSGSK
jgi:hypothetical protein